MSLIRHRNKNAFQWDAYHPLVDHIPACTAQGGGSAQAGGCQPREVSAKGVSASGPGDGGVSQHAMAQTSPPWTDRHCEKHNLLKLRLGAVIRMINVFIRTRPSDPVNVQNEAEHTSTVEIPGSCRSICRLRTYDPQVSVRQPAGGRRSSAGSVTTYSAGNARISGCCEKNQRYPYSKYNNLNLFEKITLGPLGQWPRLQ